MSDLAALLSELGMPMERVMEMRRWDRVMAVHDLATAAWARGDQRYAHFRRGIRLATNDIPPRRGEAYDDGVAGGNNGEVPPPRPRTMRRHMAPPRRPTPE